MGKLKKVLPNRYEPLPIDELNDYGNYKKTWKSSIPKGYYVRKTAHGKGPSQLVFVNEETKRYYMRKPKKGIGPSQLVFVNESTKKKKKKKKNNRRFNIVKSKKGEISTRSNIKSQRGSNL